LSPNICCPLRRFGSAGEALAFQPRSRGLPRRRCRPVVDDGSPGTTLLLPEPRSRGFSWLGFSRSLWVRHLQPLQPVVYGTACMMFPLVSHIRSNPVHILRPETDHAVAILPFQHLAPARELPIRLVGGRPLNPTNQFADEHRGRDRDHDMDMVSVPPISWMKTPAVLIRRPRM